MGRRKKHVPQQTDGMRSMWEFVFVSQFLRVFQSKFGFVRFTAKDLETSLVEPDNENLFGIFSRLLQELSQRQDIKVTSWQDYMKDELKERESEKNPMRDGRPYSKLSPEDRVLLLKFLIDLIIDNGNKELKDFADGFLDTNSTQVKPIGTDACNNIYWYFEDLRLYRETPGRRGRGSKKGQTRLNWETICVSLEDWDNILRTFKKSSNSNEKKLHQYLKNDLYPQVMPLIKENEKEEESESLKSKELPRNQQKELEIAEEESNAVREDEGEEEDKELNQGTMRKVEEVQTGGVDFEQMASEKVTEKEKEKDTGHRKRGRRKEIDKQVPVVYNTNLESHDNQHGQYMELGRKDHPLAMDAGRPVKQRRRYSRLQEQEELEKIRKDRDELEKKVDEEIKKQENILKEADLDSGLVPRSKRRCVIMREQMNKKKEWWEEENIGSDDEEDEDADSDNSDGPRKRRKAKLSRPVEMPIPPGRQRVYVFSTTLANRAAEAVHQGSYDGIVSFHLAQSATTPFLRLENNTRVGSHDMMEQQKGYMSRQTGQNMTRGYGGYPHPDTGVQPGGVGYGNQQWSQFQQQYHKDRQQQSQVMEDIQHLLFGNGNQSQSSGTPSNGLYSRGSGHNHQQSGMGQQMSQFGFSGNHAPSGQQPSSPFMDSRMHDHYRQQMQQQAYQRYSSQQQQQQQQQQTQQNLQQQKQSQQPQQQQFFQRSSMLSSLQSPSPQSPTSVPSPLGNSVRSPPPPYPGNRTTSTDNRNSGTSPAQVPSPRSGGSPQTPQTPLTPHTPRGFQATGLPSPTDVPKQPYSPSNQQSNFSGYSRQSSTHSQGGDSDTSHSQIPGFIELPRVQKPTMQPAAQNSYSIRYGNYDNRSAEETPLGSSLHSPSELSPRAAGPFHGGPPNKSPFPGPANQLQPNQGPYSSTSKSFSVESLTAPTQPSERNSHPVSGSEQSPYSGFYYPNKYPQMYSHTHAQYQYPPAHLQHPGSYYNSQYGSNMYLGRGSLPVHHPTRDSGL